MPTLTDISAQLESIRSDLTETIADVHAMQAAAPAQRRLLMCSIDGGPLHNPALEGAKLVADYGGLPFANVGDSALFGTGLTFLQAQAQSWLTGTPEGKATASVAYDWVMLDSEKQAYTKLRDPAFTGAARNTLIAEHQKAANWWRTNCAGRYILWYGLTSAPESGTGAVGNDLAAQVGNFGDAYWANCYANDAPPFADEVARQCRIVSETLRVSTKPVWVGVTPRFVDSCRTFDGWEATELLSRTLTLTTVNGRKPDRVAIWSADWYYIDYAGNSGLPPAWHAVYQAEHAAYGLPFVPASRTEFCRRKNREHMATWRAALDAVS